MFSPELIGLLRCPTDRARLELGSGTLTCTRCAQVYLLRDGYIEILPSANSSRLTLYNQDEGEKILDYREIGPPLLSAGIKNNILNEFLGFNRSDLVLDLGCGNGKFAYWNRERVKLMFGLDVAPWFAEVALRELPLFRGDIRALPFDDSTFNKIFSIDVMEHLTADDIARVLDEVRRTLKPGGELFLFSNTRERPTLAWAMAPQRALSAWLKARGIVDSQRDEWRKSDHVKAISTFEELQATFAAHGFKITRVAFWNGVFQGWIENVLMKIGEGWLSRRETGRGVLEQQVAARHKVRTALWSKGHSRYYAPLAFLTAMMSLDVKLFGRLRAGPYFALLERIS